MNKRILIVDDEPMIRLLLNRLLSLDGYVVQEAQNGAEAIGKAKVHIPDLIVMDYMMPKLDGLSACRVLRQQPETAQVPIIILSANTCPDIVTESLKAGANQFLDKALSIPTGLTCMVNKMLI